MLPTDPSARARAGHRPPSRPTGPPPPTTSACGTWAVRDGGTDLGLWPLVEALDRGAHATSPGGGALLRVQQPGPGSDGAVGHDGHDVELGWLPLGGDHPLVTLMGFAAPPSWLALGVASSGRAVALDGSDRVGDARFTVLTDRSGASAGLLHRDGRTTRMAETPVGAVADACHRALGLATPPPPATTLELWTIWWLDHLVEAAVDPGGSGPVRSWADAVTHHPATWLSWPGRRRHDDTLAVPPPGPEPSVLAASAQAVADAWPWSRLRDDPGVLDHPAPGLAADLAAWMDDGMFARWALSRYPSPADLLDACCAVLPVDVAVRLATVVVAAFGGWPAR
jgi:hypothetical protein